MSAVVTISANESPRAFAFASAGMYTSSGMRNERTGVGCGSDT